MVAAVESDGGPVGGGGFKGVLVTSTGLGSGYSVTAGGYIGAFGI